jgi:hypothetical protein
MIESTYDSCLLYKTGLDLDLESFEVVDSCEIVEMQIDDILILVNDEFATEEEKELKSFGILHKDRDQLMSGRSIKFNETIIDLSDESISLRQEIRSIENISLIQNQKASSTSFRRTIRNQLSPKNQYVTQRARETYLASICQLEASFDLSHAAQSIEFIKDDIMTLNKRLK